jgi:hypothetical protein
MTRRERDISHFFAIKSFASSDSSRGGGGGKKKKVYHIYIVYNIQTPLCINKN